MPSECRAERWTVLATWDSPGELTLALDRTLHRLDGVDRDTVLFDHVDPEGVAAVFEAPSTDRGATELQFECQHHEIRISGDGTIAAKPADTR